MSSRRRDQDLMKLMMSDFAVTLSDDSGNEFLVDFAGPADTLYAGGVWKVQVTLPKDYPYRSPSIGFKTRMFHPNVDEMSGSVCLDVINQTWTPMYDLVNIFEVFLPQLLSYPNASDPLNSEAASLLLRSPQAYKEKVLEYVKKYASLTPNSPPTSTSSTSTFSSHSSGASTTTCSTVDERRSSGESFVTWDGSEREDSMQQDGEEDDEQDELSSLSDSSDTEDNLVLDL